MDAMPLSIQFPIVKKQVMPNFRIGVYNKKNCNSTKLEEQKSDEHFRQLKLKCILELEKELVRIM